MDFLDKVKKTAASVAKVSGRESKKLYAITKIKLEITEKQNKVKALYKEIGYDAYKAHKLGEDIVASIKAKLERIDSLELEIAALRENIAVIKATEEFDDVDEEFDDETVQEAEIVETEDEVETEPIDPIE